VIEDKLVQAKPHAHRHDLQQSEYAHSGPHVSGFNEGVEGTACESRPLLRAARDTLSRGWLIPSISD
jgi:hypothetical protein